MVKYWRQLGPRIGVALGIWLIVAAGAAAQQSWDLPLTLAGTALTAAGLLATHQVAPLSEAELQALRLTELPLIDRRLLAAPNATLDLAGSLLAYGQALVPAVAAIGLQRQAALELLWRYYQVLAIAHGGKDLLKTAIRRPRPYLYHRGAPVPAANDHASAQSFPSGHATIAFASAAYLTTVAGERWGRDTALLVGSGSFAVATTVAVLRVAAGQHFVTDVVAGAALGGVIGWLVPLLHRSTGAATLYPTSPAGIGLRIALTGGGSRRRRGRRRRRS